MLLAFMPGIESKPIYFREVVALSIIVFAAQAAAMGSLFLSYFNDILYWVVNRLLGVSEITHQMTIWLVSITIAWAIGGIGVTLVICLLVLKAPYWISCCPCSY